MFEYFKKKFRTEKMRKNPDFHLVFIMLPKSKILIFDTTIICNVSISSLIKIMCRKSCFHYTYHNIILKKDPMIIFEIIILLLKIDSK